MFSWTLLGGVFSLTLHSKQIQFIFKCFKFLEKKESKLKSKCSAQKRIFSMLNQIFYTDYLCLDFIRFRLKRGNIKHNMAGHDGKSSAQNLSYERASPSGIRLCNSIGWSCDEGMLIVLAWNT